MVENLKQQESKVYSAEDDMRRIVKDVNKKLFFKMFDSKFERLSKTGQEVYGHILFGKEMENYMTELENALKSGLAKNVSNAKNLIYLKYTMEGIPIECLAEYPSSLK